jgi:S1-C subfamily serine protease
MHQRLANATFRIACGPSTGTGFSFRSERIVITNAHVIRPALGGVPFRIEAITEDGTKIPAKVLRYSDETNYDFAILELQQPLPAGRHILQPSTAAIVRGAKIAFAGFPHGIHDLLVHEAIMSGPCAQIGFYIDGSVNEGNSGGPIVSADTGEVVGIVTQRRFLNGAALQGMSKDVDRLAQQLQKMRAGQGNLGLNGIDLDLLTGNVTEGLRALSAVITSNSNVGIGIGFKIEFVDAEYQRQQYAVGAAVVQQV